MKTTNSIKIMLLWAYLLPITLVAQTNSIEEINKDPRTYHDKIVVVKGEVVASYEIPFLHFYKIKDTKGNTIHVVTKQLVPKEGEKVKVRGKVNRLYKIGLHQMVVIEEEADSY